MLQLPSQSLVLGTARDPRNLRAPQPQDLGDICPRSSQSQPEAPAAFPPPWPNSQPVSFLISSSSSSRSNVEARDPIAEPEAPPPAGAPAATAEAGGKEGREGGPGVKKEQGSVSPADWGGDPRVVRGRGRPRRAANEERDCTRRRRRRRRSRLQPPNESPQLQPRLAGNGPAPGIVTPRALKGPCHAGSTDCN